jgi:hypothetical protein
VQQKESERHQGSAMHYHVTQMACPIFFVRLTPILLDNEIQFSLCIVKI